MVELREKHGLLFASLEVKFRGKSQMLQNVLIDTGSGGTILKADTVQSVGVEIEPEDTIESIRGVGGTEFVFVKKIDELSLGGLRVEGFETEIGAMEYGFDIDGIIGLDFLKSVHAVIDLDGMKVYGGMLKR